MTWNANGLTVYRLQELQNFLLENSIDIALISETHLIIDGFIRLPDFQAYWTNHTSSSAKGLAAILINKTLRHYLVHNVNEDYIQTIGIAITLQNREMNVYAPYSLDKAQFVEILKNSLVKNSLFLGTSCQARGLWFKKGLNQRS